MSRMQCELDEVSRVQPGLAFLVALVAVATTAKRLKGVHVVELPCAHEGGIGADGG